MIEERHLSLLNVPSTITRTSSNPMSKIYVVEHLDPELGPWSTLEYLTIAQETRESGAAFWLSSLPEGLTVPREIQDAETIVKECRSVEELFVHDRGRVCLLDPAATMELCPDDGLVFDVFLFGGILGMRFLPCNDASVKSS